MSRKLSWDFSIEPTKTGLLVVDMQYVDAHPDYGFCIVLKKQGISTEYYVNRLAKLVIPNVNRLIDAARESGIRVIFTLVGCTLSDRSDVHPNILKMWQNMFGSKIPIEGTKEYEILEEIRRKENDLTLCKRGSGVFNHTNLNEILVSMGINTLIVTGVATDYCVYLSAAGAGDLGYNVIVVDDATAALSQEAQDRILNIGSEGYFIVKKTDQVLREVNQ